MKTWQAFLLHLGLALGAASLPYVKNTALQTTIGTLIVSGTALTTKSNSNSDPNGNPLIQVYPDKFVSEPSKVSDSSQPKV